MNLFHEFHFLRPGWLFALLPAMVLWWLLRRRSDPGRAWEQWVDPVLLKALLVQGTDRKRIRPIHLLGIIWLLGILTLAGPAWRREKPPFAEDEAALVIAVKVSPSMQATDIAPTRQERSAQKIGDLLAQRPGTRNALLAFAGSAHLVMPLTTDASVINTFAAELAPDIMPSQGARVRDALTLATQQLARRGETGAIVILADEFTPDDVTAAREHREDGGAPVHVLLANSNPSPEADAFAKAGGGTLTSMTPDPSDIESLARQVRQSATGPGHSGERWRDDGYFALPILAAFSLLWFRRGWVLDSGS